MSFGIGLFATDVFLYLSLFMSSATVMVSTILLILKGKVIKTNTKILMFALIIVALFIALYLIFLAVAFGNSHPSASPVPLQ